MVISIQRLIRFESFSRQQGVKGFMVMENRKRYITYTIKDMHKGIRENKSNFRPLHFVSQYCQSF